MERGIRRSAVSNGVPGRPAARRIFQYPHIVEGPLVGVERGVLPQRAESDVSLERRGLTSRQIYRCEVVWAPERLGVNRAAISTCNIEHLLTRLSVLDPPLHNLRTLQERR